MNTPLNRQYRTRLRFRRRLLLSASPRAATPVPRPSSCRAGGRRSTQAPAPPKWTLYCGTLRQTARLSTPCFSSNTGSTYPSLTPKTDHLSTFAMT